MGFALPAGAVECRPGAMVLRGPEDTPAVLTGTLTMPLLISGAVDAAGLALGEGGLLRLSGAAASRLLLGEHDITLSAGVAEWNGVQAIETSGTVFAGESCPALTLNGVAVSAGAAALDAERLLLALPEEALGQLTLTPAGAEAPLDWAAPDGENFTLAPLGEGLVQLGLRRGRKHTLTAGGGAVVFDLPPTGYTRRDEAEVYAEALGEFEALMAEAEAEQALPLRYAKLARAEAALLDAAVILPTTAQGATWTKSRVAPHSAPTVQWGADAARLQGLVVADGFLTRADREALEALWEAAVQTGGSYDPAAWLRNRGRSLKTSYTAAAYAPPASLDWHSLADTPDLDILANTVTGLLQYDNLNRLRPAMAQRWEVTEDGLRYTFHLRAGANWVTAAGETYAEVTAYDFEAGYRHAAEVPGGLGAAEGLVASVTATDRYTLVITLTRPAPWFPALLTTSAFLPLCRDFVKAAGEQYGEATGPEAQVYCGPFRLTALSSKTVVLEKNAGYFDAASVTLTRLTWRCDGGGDLDTVSVSGGDSYAFLSETASVSSFAALNLDRGTFALANGGAASEKTDAQKRDTQAALLNRAFRQALLHAFDKAAWNAVSRGAAPAEANLRNLFNHPAFVTLPAAAELEGHTFAAGTAYGALVQAFLDDRDAHID
ncbi:MAG: ABC transporter substrate-binding protein, partial [bacterium]